MLDPCLWIRLWVAFHEKAGRCQQSFSFGSLLYLSGPPLPPSFHPHSLISFISCASKRVDNSGAYPSRRTPALLIPSDFNNGT
jgi:hypothetical protein